MPFGCIYFVSLQTIFKNCCALSPHWRMTPFLPNLTEIIYVVWYRKKSFWCRIYVGFFVPNDIDYFLYIQEFFVPYDIDYFRWLKIKGERKCTTIFANRLYIEKFPKKNMQWKFACFHKTFLVVLFRMFCKEKVWERLFVFYFWKQTFGNWVLEILETRKALNI